jgi:hypothetical protein
MRQIWQHCLHVDCVLAAIAAIHCSPPPLHCVVFFYRKESVWTLVWKTVFQDWGMELEGRHLALILEIGFSLLGITPYITVIFI